VTAAPYPPPRARWTPSPAPGWWTRMPCLAGTSARCALPAQANSAHSAQSSGAMARGSGHHAVTRETSDSRRGERLCRFGVYGHDPRRVVSDAAARVRRVNRSAYGLMIGKRSYRPFQRHPPRKRAPLALKTAMHSECGRWRGGRPDADAVGCRDGERVGLVERKPGDRDRAAGTRRRGRYPAVG